MGTSRPASSHDHVLPQLIDHKRTPRVRGSLLALAIVLGALGATTSAGASHDCGSLSEGQNDLSGKHCFTLDVPEGVDVLRVTFGGYGFLTDSNDTLCSWNTYPHPDDERCAVPGPSAERLTLTTFNSYTGPVWVQFEEAQPVNIAAQGRLEQPTDGSMFRFDGLEAAAIVSAGGWPDVSLRVRRGMPPTRDQADCIANASRGSFDLFVLEGAVTPGVESCRLGPGVGPLYAFVRLNRTFSACVHWEPFPPTYYCVEDALYDFGNGTPLWGVVPEYESLAYAFVISGVGG